MEQWLKGGGAVFLLVLAGLWVHSSYKNTRLGVKGNNGVSSDMPAMSPTLQKSFENMAEKRKNDPPPEMPEPGDLKKMEEMRQKVEDEISPAQKEEFRKMSKEFGAKMQRARAAMSPADQKRMREKMMQRMGGGRRGGGSSSN